MATTRTFPLPLVFVLAAGFAAAPHIGCRDDANRNDSKATTQPGVAAAATDTPAPDDMGCKQVPAADDLRNLLKQAPGLGEAGGLAGGRKSWAAVVDRKGRVCAVVTNTDDPTDGWPGSRGIAMAKAYTANAFSTNDSPLSTARLYTLSQPGHSLWGIAAGNPLDPACLNAPGDDLKNQPRVCGGSIAFGGGLPLYRGNIKVGGLGVSGDTACTDHEIAKRVRDKAGLNPTAGAAADDITYSKSDKASAFTHPLCANTWRNGQKVGDEGPAAGY
jgi:uncharacterized protein GlcG (DUF336 family)